MSKFCPIENRNVAYIFCQECENKVCRDTYKTCDKDCVYNRTCEKHSTPYLCSIFMQKTDKE